MLLGAAVTLFGILVISLTGNAKDRDLAATGGANAVAEFNFRKGILVAVFYGVMGASFTYGLAADDEIRALEHFPTIPGHSSVTDYAVSPVGACCRICGKRVFSTSWGSIRKWPEIALAMIASSDCVGFRSRPS